MNKWLEVLLDKYPDISECQESIQQAINTLISTYQTGGKLLVCGNGGSAADSDHIVGELMKGFMKKRPLSQKEIEKFKNNFPETGQILAENLQGGLPAISLTSQSALMTAYSNDVSPEMVFAQQVYAYGHNQDTLIGISTSGNSTNVVNALKVASVQGLHTIGLTGNDGGEMKNICDTTIIIPRTSTPEIQERHLPVYHTICQAVEAAFFDK